MADTIKIIYNNKYGIITYKRKKLVVTAMLVAYDDIIKIVDFSDGLLTVLMKRNNQAIEEYVDLSDVLGMIGLSKKRKDYFGGVGLKDLELERAA